MSGGSVVVDAHHHLWDPTRREYPWMAGTPALQRVRDLDDLRSAVAASDVSATLLVQTVADLAETREFLATAAASGGLIRGVVGWVDLTADVPAQLAELRAGPGGDLLVGVRHQVEDEPGPAWLLRDDVVEGSRGVAAVGLVHDLLVRPDQLRSATDLVDRVGGPFVLDHGAKPPAGAGFDSWAVDVADLARRRNVACKLSGLFTLDGDPRPAVRHLLAVFGPDRLIFGTDWPVSTLAADYVTVCRRTRELLVLDEDEERAVFGGNAVRTYRLNPSPTTDRP